MWMELYKMYFSVVSDFLLNTVFSGFFHGVACITTSFLFSFLLHSSLLPNDI